MWKLLIKTFKKKKNITIFFSLIFFFKHDKMIQSEWVGKAVRSTHTSINISKVSVTFPALTLGYMQNYTCRRVTAKKKKTLSGPRVMTAVWEHVRAKHATRKPRSDRIYRGSDSEWLTLLHALHFICWQLDEDIPQSQRYYILNSTWHGRPPLIIHGPVQYHWWLRIRLFFFLEEKQTQRQTQKNITAVVVLCLI